MTDALSPLFDLVPAVDLSRRERMALLIIDMQYHDASPARGLGRAIEAVAPGAMDYYNQRLEGVTVPAIGRMLEFFRREGIAVVHLVLGSRYQDLRECPPRFREWTRNLERVTGARDIWWSGNPDFAVREELAPIEGETVVRKTTNGGFNGSGLDDVLRRMDIDTLVVAGVVTSACVETTVRDAADRGYHCALVDEATADYDPEMHRATLKAFSLNFGRVLDSADALIEAVDRRASV